MTKKKIDYNLAISEFLTGVSAWLDERVPRDANDIAEIAETKEMWKKVCSDPRYYVQNDVLDNEVCGHTKGFCVKYGIGKSDTSMMFIVIQTLLAMDEFYKAGELRSVKQEAKLMEKINKYKTIHKKARVKNAINRFVDSFKKPTILLISPIQR